MATVTHAVSTASTLAATSYLSGAFTPNTGDLLVSFVQGGSTSAVGTMTDSQALGWDLVNSILKGGDTLYFFVARQLVPASISTTVTFDCTGDQGSGAVIEVARVSGMQRIGTIAVRQSNTGNGNSGNPPEVIFGVQALTTNPILGAVENTSNPAGLTAPATGSFVEQDDTGYNTPTSGLEYVSSDTRGSLITTITWGSNSATNWGAMVVELDITSPPPSATSIYPSDMTPGSEIIWKFI